MTSIKGYFKDIDGQSFIEVDKEENIDLINSLKTSSVYNEPINKSDLKVMVLNGTSKNGLANNVKLHLYDLGYGVVKTGNIDKVKNSKIQTKDDKNVKEILKKDTGIKNVEDNIMSDYDDYDVVVIIGEDKKDDFKTLEYGR